MGRDRRAARAGRPRLRPALLALVALLLASGCSGASRHAQQTSTPLASIDLRTATAAPAGDPGAVVEQAIAACREKDAGLLRSLVAANVPDAAIAALLAGGSDVRLAGRTPAEIEGDRATVVVHLEIRRDGVVDAVQRTWQLDRSGGPWRFTQLPDCY